MKSQIFQILSLLIAVAASTASSVSSSSLTSRSCKKFTPSGGEPYQREAEPVRASRGFFCDSPGKTLDTADFPASCPKKSSCALGSVAGEVFTMPDTNATWTRNDKKATDEFWALVEGFTSLKAKGLPGTEQFIAGKKTICVPQGSGAAIMVKVAMKCIDGVLSDCESGTPDEKVVRACVPKTQGGRVTLDFQSLSLTAQEVRGFTNDPFAGLVRGAAPALVTAIPTLVPPVLVGIMWNLLF